MQASKEKRVILICGKICSGKSTYAEKLKREIQAVILSCDEITLTLFEEGLGEHHDEMTERVKRYLFQKSLDLLEAGVSVILDWGFWKRAERDAARRFYEEQGIPYEMHYIEVSHEEWKLRIAKRNQIIEKGRDGAYFVDEGLAEKAEHLFEKPVDETMYKV